MPAPTVALPDPADTLLAAAYKLRAASLVGTPITLPSEALGALSEVLMSKARVARFVVKHGDQQTIRGVAECCHVQLARAVLVGADR